MPFYCKRPSHIEKDCRTKKRDLNNQGPKPQANFAAAKVAPEEEHPTSIKLFATSISPKDPIIDQWYFDTGTTHHVTYNYQWLVN